MADNLTRRTFLGAGAAALAASALPRRAGAIEAPALVLRGATRPVAISSANSLAPVSKALELVLAGHRHPRRRRRGRQDPGARPQATTRWATAGSPTRTAWCSSTPPACTGPTKRAGAVGCLEGIKTPSEVARLVLKYTNHIMLVGEGAKRFALSYGFKDEDLLTDGVAAALAPLAGQSGPRTTTGSTCPRARRWWCARPARSTSNVVNAAGDLSSVTTTSGLALKISGRVGDSPIVGAGQYTDNDVGAGGLHRPRRVQHHGRAAGS